MQKLILVLAAIVIVVFLLINSLSAEKIERVKLIKDVRQLAEVIESAHPDPYIRGGGKIAFHRTFQNILNGIPADGMNRDEFYRLISPLIAGVGDMHTWMNAPYDHNWLTGPWGIPLYFKIVDSSLYVAGVPDQSQRGLLGSVLVSVEGVPFEELLERNKNRIGAENTYSVLRDMAKTGILIQGKYLEHLLPEWQDKKHINVVLRNAEGVEREYNLEIPASMTLQSMITFRSEFELPSRDRIEFVYEFLDSNRETALLVVDGMMSYREAFEIWNSYDFHNNDSRAEDIYLRYNEDVPPDDIAGTIAGLPSATELFRSLVTEMKDAGTETLLIDLRRNDGGNSYMSEILVYFLYGLNPVIEQKAKNLEIWKYSRPYFEYFENESLENVNVGRGVALTENDYDFTYDYANMPNLNMEQVNAEFDEAMARMTTFYEEYKSGEYQAYYCPENVIVLCSPYTFSSGYTMMYKLYRAGAKILGTPSAQSGNCFGDIMYFELDNSRLSFSVSRKYYELFPDDPEMGKVLRPHYPVTYDILSSYNFDPNAEILYALDLVNNRRVGK
jgi:hypothetical protein